jgi:hypothetical protein
MNRVIRAKFREVDKKVIIKCPECTQKLRLPLLQTKKITIKCPKCNTEFKFDYKKYHVKQIAINSMVGLALVSLCSCIIVLPLIAVPKLNVSIEKFKSDYAEKIANLESDFSREINTFKDGYNRELVKFDNDKYRNELHEQATAYYTQIWSERKNYNSQYAITHREKAQLEMLSLTKDRTKTMEKIIRSIAIKAAPKNSTINVFAISNGLRLDIDFDMSELTSGERGSRTKHLTIESLKKEVIRLISRVTNDVYRFCQDLDLSTIAIGCRHYVNYETGYSSSKERNTILYKIRLDKKDIKELKNNPFLDIYSTTRYFKIEEDDFPNLRIIKETL